MIKIIINRSPGIDKIKITDLYSDSLEFFHELLTNIDQHQIARFYIQMETSYPMDFGFDFLSVYDFFGSILKFINDHETHTFKDLLLYERGNSKLRLSHIQENRIEVIYFSDPSREETRKIYTLQELNSIFKEMVNQLVEIKSFFSLSVKNERFFNVWINSVLNEIR